MSRAAALVTLSCLLAAGARAEEPGAWETVLTGPITIKNRKFPGSQVREILAEGDLAAPVYDIEQTLMVVSRFKHFMPYLKDCREISERQPDDSVYVYTLIDLPVVGRRDYVVRTWLKETSTPEGGTFRNEWKAFPDHLPRRNGISRVELNEGGWVVTPGENGKSHAVYRFVVDPGGWVPAFAVNMANQQGVAETFKAVEKEARRRRDERMAKAQGPATVVVGQP